MTRIDSVLRTVPPGSGQDFNNRDNKLGLGLYNSGLPSAAPGLANR